MVENENAQFLMQLTGRAKRAKIPKHKPSNESPEVCLLFSQDIDRDRCVVCKNEIIYLILKKFCIFLLSVEIVTVIFQAYTPRSLFQHSAASAATTNPRPPGVVSYVSFGGKQFHQCSYQTKSFHCF